MGDEELVLLCLLEWRLEKDATQKRRKNGLEACRKRLLKWQDEVVKPVRKTVRWLLGKVVRVANKDQRIFLDD